MNILRFWLLAAARLLKQRESNLKGTVLLVFQPAEEGFAGGKEVIDSGALKGVSAIHGMHVWPTLPTAHFASKVSNLFILIMLYPIIILSLESLLYDELDSLLLLLPGPKSRVYSHVFVPFFSRDSACKWAGISLRKVYISFAAQAH